MADNIGTITVAIEAQTDELKSGLESAERAVKESSKEMEKSVENFSERAEKSWTEFASKLGVIQQVAGIAKNAMQGLADSAAVLGDESTTSAEKFQGVLGVIENSGIPVLSEAVSIGQNLRDVFDGTAAELAKVAQEMERVVEMEQRVAFLTEVSKTNRALALQVELMRLANEAEEKREMGVSDVTEQFMIQRKQMEAGFRQQMVDLQERMSVEKLSGKEQKTRIETLRKLQLQILDELDVKEKRAHEKFLKQQQEKEEREKQLGKKRIENNEKVLEDLTNKTQEVEVGIVEQASGGTVGASTAIGGFTIATGRSENKKQTSLLQKIAESNEQVARAVTKNGASGAIVPAQ